MLKKLIFILFISLFCLGSAGILLIRFMAGPQSQVPEMVTYKQNNPVLAQTDRCEFTVLSLNLAHGRGNGSHQITKTTPEIRTNLDSITRLLKGVNPDIVALQEADDPSLWSGRFSHVAYLARNTGYGYSVHGTHVQGFGLTYGTALLSQGTLSNPLSMTFSPSPPTLTKGFTVASVKINGILETDVVSVHLDFFSKRTRRKQIQTMISALKKRHKPLIIMGDFNSTWQDASAPKTIGQALGLTTHQPENNELITFPALHKRIDFILVSKEFKISEYRVLPEVVSDHRAVLARLRIQ